MDLVKAGPDGPFAQSPQPIDVALRIEVIGIGQLGDVVVALGELALSRMRREIGLSRHSDWSPPPAHNASDA